MNNKDLFKAIGYIEDSLVEKANMTSRTNKKSYGRWGTVAACAVLLLGGLAIYKLGPTPLSDSLEISQQTEVSSSPAGIRKILNYNGYRYEFVGNGAEFKFTGLDDKSLGKDYDSTFAVGGGLYEIPTYPSHFRIAVKYEQNYYLAEIVAKINGPEMTAKEYLEMSNLKELAQEINILNHIGNDVLKRITNQAFIDSIIEGLYSTKNVDLTNKEYENIGSAQSQGKSYQLQFNMKDGTQMAMYIIPELKVVSMGDTYYRLSNVFFDQAGDIFSGLKQEALPLY